ncbi:SDR family oxidoreductase [Paraburkholderia madseniana]|uniref:SDR family oxidoreductase n=1 Tax=Paraburkholderia madseniana TaxID=2599607 RepID=A0AAP5ESM9_9BURK|nr:MULTISPECIES: SDR family oxidoreductase [Paraburkholderia]MCX4144583.1 SDR family oxidoreductase [Paraburkholderia madseniana]MDN7147535.1 SDR family oxidoreductase [Paraburkholderia sp. WS6]MDQ6406415.1 SDR family oxidoreductase [Paraburkholderia madseniana]
MKRTWFITGVNSGFGRHMTEQLLARGDRIAGTVRDLESMADLKARHGDALWLAKLDLTDTPAIRRVVDLAFGELEHVDVVVSNAGYGLFGAAEEMTDEQIAHQIDTNLLGSIQTVRAALPHLRSQGGGRIIQLSTMGGQAVFPGGSLYHASKWGIEGFIDALAQEVAVFNIGCTLVEPGGARTNFRYQSARLSSKLDVYDASPARMAHRMIEDGTNMPIGDAAKMAAIMIDSVDQQPAPRRLALGSDAYNVMRKQLSDRLAALETQKELAFSTDFPAGM